MAPQDLFLKLTELLHSDLSHSPPRVLIEEGLQATCKEVRLLYNGQMATYKFDKQSPNVKSLLPFYNSQGGRAHAMCDYIIFCPREDKLHIFFCNLKSNNMSNSHDQVNAGFLFANFLIQTAARCLNYSGYPNFVEYKAIHFTTNTKLFRPLIGSKPPPMEKYENNLRYVYRPCNKEVSLDNIRRLE